MMRSTLFSGILSLLFLQHVTCYGQHGQRLKHTWRCMDTTCVKHVLDYNTSQKQQSLNVCKLMCGESILWPLPHRWTIQGSPVPIDHHISRDNFQINLPLPDDSHPVGKLLTSAIHVFIGRTKNELKETGSYVKDGRPLRVTITVHDSNFTQLSLSLTAEQEAYTMTVDATTDQDLVQVSIEGETFFGVRHGLETLSQLIVYDEYQRHLVMPSRVNVEDWPAFPYRGLMLDTARNYFSVGSIKRTIDIMSANKLNTFHWHLSDSQSFPLKLGKFPGFAQYGAYSSDKVYTEEDLLSIVEFARVRGIRVVPELDAPAHVGEGWQAVPEALSCHSDASHSAPCGDTGCGQLDPLQEDVYDTLGGLYGEYLRLFQTAVFHMGGDEVTFGCWQTNQIHEWIKSTLPSMKQNVKQVGFLGALHDLVTNMFKESAQTRTEGYKRLWAMFQEKALTKLIENTAGNKLDVILWTSDLTKPENIKYLAGHDYVIQVWSSLYSVDAIAHILENKHRVILSNSDSLYLDCGVGNWVGTGLNWCSPYKTWQKIYDNTFNLLNDLPKEKRDLILGQEVPLWSETVSEGSLDSRLWPRASAMAERTWTNPQSDWTSAEARMLYNRERLVRLGAKADAIAPEWCHINSRQCMHSHGN